MKTKCGLLFLLLLISVALLVLGGCANGCPSATQGTTGGTDGGPATGVSGGGSSCGISSGPPPSSGTTALMYYSGGTNIQGAKFDSSGNGTFANLNPFTPPALSGTVNSMAIVNKQFLYVPLSGFSNVQAYSINRSSGALSPINGSPFLAQAAADTVTTDPSGRFLFVGGRYASSISVYQINSSTGALTPAPGSPFQSFNVVFASSLTVDATGKFLYVGQLFSTNPVAVFSIDQTTGALTETSGSPYHLGVAVVQADPGGNFLLGIADDTGASGDKHIYVFSINTTTGAPTAVTNSPFATVSIPFALAIHPTGKFVYPSVADSNGFVTTFEGYQLNSTSGALTALSGSPFTTLPIVAECQFEQTGAFAFCMNISGFSVLGVNTSTGALSRTFPDLAASNNFPFAVTD